MRHPSLTPALACIPIVLAGAAEAQAVNPSASFGHAIAITTGLTFTDRLDATASPRPFSGVGSAVGMRYHFEPGTWSLTTEASGGRASYKPRDELAGSETAISGGLSLTLDRSATTFHSTTLRLGLTVDTHAELLEHRYADGAATLSSFVSGFGTLGPTATVRRALGTGDLSATAFVPVVGLAHQPYANIRQEREPVAFRRVGFSELRGVSLGARYESSRNARVGIVAEYRLKSFDYTGGWRTRSFTNSTALGIVTRFGAKAR